MPHSKRIDKVEEITTGAEAGQIRFHVTEGDTVNLPPEPGGVMYTYPNKEALEQALIYAERSIAEHAHLLAAAEAYRLDPRFGATFREQAKGRQKTIDFNSGLNPIS